MKALILLLLVVLVFLGCAFIGFQVADQLNPPQAATETADLGVAIRGDQKNLLFIRLDQLDSPQPRLISVWFISLFFLENHPTILTMAQLYPNGSAEKAELLERTFAFTAEGSVSPAFLDAVNTFGIEYKNYIVLDNSGAESFLQWLVGPEEFAGGLEAAASSPESSLANVERICKKIADASEKELGHFNWNSLAPNHFRSNLGLEDGLALWDRLIDTGPARCDIVRPK